MSFINWRVATAEDLAAVSVQLIRTELQRRSLSTTGNKEELIDRLLVDIAKDPPPAHEPAPSASDISTPLASTPAPTMSFPAMPTFTSDPAENMQVEPLQVEHEPDENEPLWSQLNKAALVQLQKPCPTRPLQTSSSSPLPSDPLDDPLTDVCLGAQLTAEERTAVKCIIQRHVGLFSTSPEDIGLYEGIEHEIKLVPDAKPYGRQPYRYTASDRQFLERMLLDLVEFDFSVEHRPGRQNHVADMLSRYSCATVSQVHNLRTLQAEDTMCKAIRAKLLSGQENQNFIVANEILCKIVPEKKLGLWNLRDTFFFVSTLNMSPVVDIYARFASNQTLDLQVSGMFSLLWANMHCFILGTPTKNQ
ncbi:hypothetical protein MTO96_028755, partial [Rhipicephalus appendiculatus]